MQLVTIHYKELAAKKRDWAETRDRLRDRELWILWQHSNGQNHSNITYWISKRLPVCVYVCVTRLKAKAKGLSVEFPQTN